MHRSLRYIVTFCLSLLTVVPSSHLAIAQESDSGDTALPDDRTNDEDADEETPDYATGVGNGGVVEAGVNGPSSSGGGGGGGGGNALPGPATFGPACTWTPITLANSPGTGEAPPEGGDADTQFTNDAGELGWYRKCPGTPLESVWTTPAVDPITLVPGASARARAQLPLPAPDMSPAAGVGSVVNLGLWLAIDDPGTTVARATLGTSWAEVEGKFDHVTIDPGDGSDPIECEGFGTPYPVGSEDPGEGPCGYTYLQRTSDDDPNQMTYTITYRLKWSTSDGRAGSLGTYERAITFDYDIDEIQIVGTGAE